MINEKNAEKYCKDFTKIENYEAAIADTVQMWECHHRMETHNSDGERRLVDLSIKELKALGIYYNRPSEELIFLTSAEHNRLHKKGNKYNFGKPLSEEAKAKISTARKGKSNPHKGIIFSEESKRKMSEAKKGKPSNVKGKHWKLVDGKRVYY